jgi:hypothetical protein
MKNLNIIRQRQYTQRLAGTLFERPEEVVQWLGAVQSQEYVNARWAVGQRMKDGTDAAVERAFAEGAILRTHVLRPTWHFVTSTDIRWMLEATAPRVHALNAYYYRQLELEADLLLRSHALIGETLGDGQARTRSELASVLAHEGIIADGPRLAYIVMYAELEQLVCSGPRRGNQQTYMLLEERAPQAKRLSREEALVELALRFFTGHGPATVNDYVKWASLTMTEARAGLEAVRHRLTSETVDGLVYWFAVGAPAAEGMTTGTYLLPEYDETTNAYKDLSIEYAPGARRGDLLRPLVMDGLTVGNWSRTIGKKETVVEFDLFLPLNSTQTEALAGAVERYSAFLGVPVKVLLREN